MLLKKFFLLSILLFTSIFMLIFIGNNCQYITLNLEPFWPPQTEQPIILPISMAMIISFALGTIIGNMSTWLKILKKNRLIKNLSVQNQYLEQQLKEYSKKPQLTMRGKKR